MNNSTVNSLKLYILYCSNSVDIDELNGLFPPENGDEHKIISLPCSGKVNLLYFLKAFETGADGLILITCPKNECHYLEGSLRAPKRAGQVELLLEEIGMGAERIAVFNVNGEGLESIVSRAQEFRTRIRSITPIPAHSKDTRISAGAF